MQKVEKSQRSADKMAGSEFVVENKLTQTRKTYVSSFPEQSKWRPPAKEDLSVSRGRDPDPSQPKFSSYHCSWNAFE